MQMATRSTKRKMHFKSIVIEKDAALEIDSDDEDQQQGRVEDVPISSAERKAIKTAAKKNLREVAIRCAKRIAWMPMKIKGKTPRHIGGKGVKYESLDRLQEVLDDIAAIRSGNYVLID